MLGLKINLGSRFLWLSRFLISCRWANNVIQNGRFDLEKSRKNSSINVAIPSPLQESVVVCNYNYDVDNCGSRREQADGRDVTWDLVRRHRQRRSADRHDEDDDYFNTVFEFDADYRGQVRVLYAGWF